MQDSNSYQFAWLKKDFHYHTKLRTAYMAKLIIVAILVAAAIAFAVCLAKKNLKLKDVGGLAFVRQLFQLLTIVFPQLFLSGSSPSALLSIS